MKTKTWILIIVIMFITSLNMDSRSVYGIEREPTFEITEDNLVKLPINNLESEENQEESVKEGGELPKSAAEVIQAKRPEPYNIDYGMKKPNESGLEELAIVDIETDNYVEFKKILEEESSGRYRLTTNIKFPNSSEARIIIPRGANKELDLNGNKLDAGALGHIEVNSQYFKLMNGEINGGYVNPYYPIPTIYFGEKDFYERYRGGFVFSPTTVEGTSLVFEDISHESLLSGQNDKARGGFAVAMKGDIFFQGENTLKNGNFNVKGGNVTFIDGTFKGIVTYTGISDGGAFSRGTGAVNLSFPGYDDNPRRAANSVAGTRRVTILENASVDLENRTISSSPYHNNIGNFSTITVDGALKMTGQNPSMRTIASERDTESAGKYDSDAQTWNGMSNINVNEGASFYAESTRTDALYGVIYTYRVNLNAYNPKFFDLRYFGQSNFFKAYQRHSGPSEIRNSNFNLYNMDVGVWSRTQKGIGNPEESYENVTKLEVNQFYEGNRGTVKAEHPKSSLQNFDINIYGRVSNDISIPVIIPDDEFKVKERNYEAGNGKEKLYGTTDYYNPEGKVLLGRPAVGALIELRQENTIFASTTVKDDGTWSFDDFSAKRFRAGNYTLNLVDKDQRKDEVPMVLTDTLGPYATPKLYKVRQGDQNAFKNPRRDSLDECEDETSPENKLKVEYVFQEYSREYMIENPGYYDVLVHIRDEKGNLTEVTSPVMVYEKIIPTTAFVSGKDFEIDFDKWDKSTDQEKREILINPLYGEARGFVINNNTVTEVTNDASKFIVTIPNKPSGGWQPETNFDVKISVDGYSKNINVFLKKKFVTMSIKQIYKDDHSKSIYGDLDNEKPVNNDKNKYLVEIGSSINDSVEKIIKDDKANFKINYDGYNDVDTSSYKVTGASNHILEVPNENFEIYYEYVGLIELIVSDLDFKDTEITGKDNAIFSPKGSAPGVNQDIQIINTTLTPGWKLNVALPKGIHIVNKDTPYLGGLIFGDEKNPTIIDKDGVMFSNQLKENNKVKSNVPMDIKLYQNIGNTLDSYIGEVEWTLYDTP